VEQLRGERRGQPVYRLAGRPRHACCQGAEGGNRLGPTHLDQRVQVESHQAADRPAIHRLPGVIDPDSSSKRQRRRRGLASLVAARSCSQIGRTREFHNTSVTHFGEGSQARLPMPGLRWFTPEAVEAASGRQLRCCDGAPPPHAELVDSPLHGDELRSGQRMNDNEVGRGSLTRCSAQPARCDGV